MAPPTQPQIIPAIAGPLPPMPWFARLSPIYPNTIASTTCAKVSSPHQENTMLVMPSIRPATAMLLPGPLAAAAPAQTAAAPAQTAAAPMPAVPRRTAALPARTAADPARAASAPDLVPVLAAPSPAADRHRYCPARAHQATSSYIPPVCINLDQLRGYSPYSRPSRRCARAKSGLPLGGNSRSWLIMTASDTLVND